MIAGSAMDNLLVAASLQACSGLWGLILPRRSALGQRIAVAFMVAGGAIGIGAVAPCLVHGAVSGRSFLWTLPVGRFDVSLDALSAVFLLPALLITTLGSIYGLSYWRQAEHPQTAVKLQVFYGLLAAAITLVVVARDGVLFLMAWEVMALSAYFLMTTEDHDAAVRSAGWVYLVATHVGTLALMAMIGRSAGRPDWVVLGLAGALLHVWNHGLFKSLLFFGAGSVIHATGTREIDRLGGLAKVLPKTFALFLVGACAISGGPYVDHPEQHNGAEAVVPVDLYVPGCPPHPFTILDGLLRLLGKMETAGVAT